MWRLCADLSFKKSATKGGKKDRSWEDEQVEKELFLQGWERRVELGRYLMGQDPGRN